MVIQKIEICHRVERFQKCGIELKDFSLHVCAYIKMSDSNNGGK